MGFTGDATATGLLGNDGGCGFGGGPVVGTNPAPVFFFSEIIIVCRLEKARVY